MDDEEACLVMISLIVVMLAVIVLIYIHTP